MEAYTRPKMLRVVGNHKIKDVWEDDLAFKVHGILEQKMVDWTSTDVVRIGYVDDPPGTVVLWIGVNPDSDSVPYEVAVDTVSACKTLLSDYGIVDVDVEMRLSKLTRYAGPSLLRPVIDFDARADLSAPFNNALTIPICSELTPWAAGSSGFFLEGGDDGKTRKRLFLVTARHVVFPGSSNLNNEPFEHKHPSQKRHNVLIINEASFREHLVSVDDNINTLSEAIGFRHRRLELVEGEDDSAKARRKKLWNDVNEFEEIINGLNALRTELSTDWSTDESRTLGHVIFSPPIVFGAGPSGYTQDVAVIEIDNSKLDPGSFGGNVLDLGTKYQSTVFENMMYRSPKNPHKFEFPGNHLLSIRGTIPDTEMRKPNMYDERNERCIMVIKNGRSSGVTIGRAEGIFSYTRIHSNITGISKEWAILPFDKEKGAFSQKGDSGAAVIDGRGRIGGLLTGGTGLTESTDITYVTPIGFIMNVIHGNESLANAHIKAGPPA